MNCTNEKSRDLDILVKDLFCAVADILVDDIIQMQQNGELLAKEANDISQKLDNILSRHFHEITQEIKREISKDIILTP